MAILSHVCVARADAPEAIHAVTDTSPSPLPFLILHHMSPRVLYTFTSISPPRVLHIPLMTN
eukprot:9425216-Pyramimonas_sp.AAC.1